MHDRLSDDTNSQIVKEQPNLSLRNFSNTSIEQTPIKHPKQGHKDLHNQLQISSSLTKLENACIIAAQEMHHKGSC